MKINKLFSIDLELYEKLRQFDNQSKVINDLLKDFFRNFNKDLSEIDQNVAILRDFKRKTKEINRKVKVFKELRHINADESVIKWVVAHMDFDKESFESELETHSKRMMFNLRKRIDKNAHIKAREIIKKNGDFFKHA